MDGRKQGSDIDIQITQIDSLYIQVLVVGAAIAPILTICNLGAMFDQSLTMDDFVSTFGMLLISLLHNINISSIRKCLWIVIFRPLYWLEARRRIIFVALVLTSKALNNLTPDYLTLLLDTHKPQCQLRSSDSFLLTVPHIRSIDTLNKYMLKLHLFTQEYG